MANKFDDMFKQMAEAGMTEEEFLAQFKKAQAAAEDEYARRAWLEEIEAAEQDLIESMDYYIETIFSMGLDEQEYRDLEKRVRETTKIMIKLRDESERIEKEGPSEADVDKIIKRFVKLLG